MQTKQCREQSRRFRFKSRGLTESQYESMIKEQGGLCAICGYPESDPRGHNFPIDHCHQTGKVRGLLCHKCNRGLGAFSDSTEILKNAINYLDRTGIEYGKEHGS